MRPAPQYVVTSCTRLPGTRLSRLGEWGNRRFDSVEAAEDAAVAMGAVRGDIQHERGR